MKLYNHDLRRAARRMSYAGLMEKIEILRSTLRWATGLRAAGHREAAAPGQCAARRSDAAVAQGALRAGGRGAAPSPRPPPVRRERRQALLARSFVFEGTFGDNPKLLDALEIAEKAAPTDLPVLIDGESGTGKELMAKVIHANGARADRPYHLGQLRRDSRQPAGVANCSATSKGAFTGRANDRKGKFESAHNGTIFLDEIGELPLPGR